MERLKLVLLFMFSEKDRESTALNPALIVFRIIFIIFLGSSVLPVYSLGLFKPFPVKPEYTQAYPQE